MSQKQIVITVNQNGDFSIEAQGFQGNSCEQATAGLENALGKLEKKAYKPEYHQTQQNVNYIHQ
jgi:hypothetical protein